MADEPTNADILDALLMLTKRIDARDEIGDQRHAAVMDKLDEAAAEREAIRNVVDNDLASQGQVMQLEGKLTELQRATRQNGQKIDKLSTRMDRSGIPAE